MSPSSIPPLANKCAIVTGANRGLGLEIAKHYVAAGAKVCICARDAASLEEASSELKKTANDDGRIFAMRADVSQRADVRAFVAASVDRFGRLDVVVSNAGVIGPAGPVEAVEWEDWVRAVEVNLLGAVLLCREVLPHLQRNGGGKIIQISGGGATQPLPMLSAYAASKAGVIRFVETLAEEVREQGISVNAIAPGALNTRMLTELLAAGPDKVGAKFYKRLQEQKSGGGVPLSKGAELAVFLASAASDGITGKLISAAWDPWNSLPDHLRQLQRSDVYTLRRIVPSDRDMNWGDEP